MSGEKKAVVVYESRCGSTKRYAEWISGAVNADLIDLSKVKISKLMKYDVIVFGGCLTAMSISGLKRITGNLERFNNKKIIVFANGIGASSEEYVEKLAGHNFPGDLRKKVSFIYLRGAFDLSKLNFLYRTMLSNLKRMFKNKKEGEMNEDMKMFLSVLDHPVDYTDEKAVKPLVELIRG